MISLEMPQRKRASSLLEGRTSWIFSSCGRSLLSYEGELRDPLVWPQEKPVSMRVVRGLSGFLSSKCWVLSPCLALRLEPQSSSPVPTWISGFHWSFHRGEGLVSCGSIPIRSPLKLEKHCQASCRVDIGIGGFLSKCHKAVIPAIVF